MFRYLLGFDQSTSLARVMAGDAGFFTLIQCDDRPARYARSRCFDTSLSSNPNGYYHAGPKRNPIPDAACMPQRAPQGGGTIATTASAGAAHPP
jgi:hypothetical protein